MIIFSGYRKYSSRYGRKKEKDRGGEKHANRSYVGDAFASANGMLIRRIHENRRIGKGSKLARVWKRKAARSVHFERIVHEPCSPFDDSLPRIIKTLPKDVARVQRNISTIWCGGPIVYHEIRWNVM